MVHPPGPECPSQAPSLLVIPRLSLSSFGYIQKATVTWNTVNIHMLK